MSATPTEAPSPGIEDRLAAHLGAAAGDRTAGLLAFALAVEGGAAAAVPPARRIEEAERELETWAFRRLHNRIEEIRREAVAEASRAQPSGPGFLTLVAANLVAIAIVGAAAWAWLTPTLASGGP